MRVLLDPQVFAAAITVLLTAAAAALGFFLREWMARVKPFVAVVSIDGDVRRAATYVDVPETVLSTLKDAPILNDLADKSSLPDIDNVLNQTMHVKKEGPLFLELVAQFRRLATNSDTATAQSTIAAMLASFQIDKWLTILFGEKHIVPPAHDPTLPIIVTCTFAPNHKNGCYMIGLLGEGTTYGQQFNQFSLYRQNSEPFISLLERMELLKLADAFEQAAKIMSDLLATCKDVIPLLQDIVNKNSQWTIRLYLANLAKTPLMLRRDATLHVIDKKSGGRYTADLALILIRTNTDHAEERYEARAPLVVRSESDVTFEFATRDTQGQMENGDALRLLFSSGTGECFISFTLERTGLWRLQQAVSPKERFCGQ